MNFKTFYKIYYRHRVQKASSFLKMYLFLVIPIRYLMNCFYFEKNINLDEFSKKNEHLFIKDLSYLFEFFNSDKGQKFYNQYPQPIKIDKNKKIQAHNYAKYYEKYLSKFKNKKNAILELGSFYGNASAAFYFYFRNSKIYGGDINPDMFKYNSKRINSFFINSGSEESIKKNDILKNNNFDIIVEDASHMLKDQIISLFLLFPKINSGGIVFIEELDFPEKKLDMRINQKGPDLKEILIKIQNNDDFDSIYIDDYHKKYFLENYQSIEIFNGNFNQIAIIKKKIAI